MELKPTAFFGAIKHEHIDEVEGILKQYDIGKYIIGLEVSEASHSETGGEHMHFYVEMSGTDYIRFAKRIFIDRFKLRGKAVKGSARQYGKVKQIENLESMQAYTVKDGNVRTNMSANELEVLTKKSYKKKDKEDEYTELMNVMNEQLGQMNIWQFNLVEARKVLVMWYIKKQIKKDLSKNNVERMIRMWICYFAPWSDNDKFEVMERCFYSNSFKYDA